MSLIKHIRLSLAVLLLALSLAACSPAAPTAAPATPTATQAPTETLEPTETLYPTETPPVAPTSAVTEAAGTPAATTAAGTPAATTAAGAPTKAAAQPAGGAPADQYTYMGQSIADKTQILPGRQVTITWTVKNSGTTGWTKDYVLRYFSGPKPDKDFYNFTKDVPAGATINFIVTFTTPTAPGDYDLWFKLTNAAGQNFGDLDFAFTVSNSPNNTVKPTATKAP